MYICQCQDNAVKFTENMATANRVANARFEFQATANRVAKSVRAVRIQLSVGVRCRPPQDTHIIHPKKPKVNHATNRYFSNFLETF